jgi:tRNA(Ile)-lysidine synthase
MERLLGPWPGAGPVLAAVSGGGDSVALLLLLRVLAPAHGWRLVVGHVDHGLRQDSEADARFVAELAARLGLECLVQRVEVPGEGSREEAARRVRRQALMEMAARAGAEVIALGHTADDQAETLLARLLTGTGLTGLAGMRPWSPPWWRPLLGLRRSELRGFLRACGQSWRRDPSNQDPGPLRNRIRHRLLPLAAELVNPRVVEALGRLAELCRQEEDFWQAWCEERFAALGRREGTSYCLALEPFLALPVAGRRRLLRWVVARLTGRGQHLLSHHVDQLLELAQGRPGRRLELPLGLVAWREHRHLRLDQGGAPGDFTCRLEGPGWVWLEPLACWLAVEEVAAPEQLQARGPEVYIPLARVAWPLVVRPVRRGERFRPLGAPGSKRISRFLIDRKVPAWWRRRTVVVADRRGVWWVGPWSLAERARRRPGENTCLCLRLVPRGWSWAECGE